MTDLETLQQEIDEWHDAIREMEIDLRETIHEAILDREELNRRMLEGRIDLENELLDVLARRYEKERDELLEVAGLKREALSEELELLDEQLEARRKLNEEEDRAGKLEELEEQLERISADPTRKKEELALREEIAELREEIAWDLAESEVDAQKKSIESQIESVDDYMEYVENYYEELLSNPRRLIEEIQDLLTKTDSEILAWLEQNHEDYQTATDATREEMRLGWQEMLDDMRGNTQTYWDEVEQIIAQGDEAIIEFLKANSADYKEAGKLQAEAYVDEWTKKLEDLKNAYKKVSDEIKSYSYTPTSSSKSSGSGGGSSSGSRSSGSSSKSTPRFVASGTGYAEAYRGKITSVSYNGETYIKGHNSNYWYITLAPCTPFVRELEIGHTQGSNAVTSQGGFLPHMEGQYLYLGGWQRIQQVTDASNAILSGSAASTGSTQTPVITMNEIELSGAAQLTKLEVETFPRVR